MKEKLCEQCGEPLAQEGALEGRCPSCLLGAALQDTSGPESGPDSIGGMLEPRLHPGEQLGPYRIEECIGAGGMGQVYRARDTRLERLVAIKIIHERFSERFEREARAIAALNHPHICTLYDIGPNYLVMELLEGETLAARLQKGPLPIDLVLRYGAEIAGTLAAAHATGITHRDLKPGNLMFTKSGVKLLDFGLATLASARAGTLMPSGGVAGTPGYMAPEQLEGKPCDARTDIFALGMVLYEMAAGKRLVPGEGADLAGVPGQCAHVIERCVARDAEDRWQSARDVKAELEWAARSRATSPSPEAPKPPRAWRPMMAWSLAAILLAALVVISLLHLREPSVPAAAPVRFQIPTPGSVVNASTVPVISPDGRKVAFRGALSDRRPSFWVHLLDSGETRLLSGAQDSSGTLFWSPDSRFLVYPAAAEGKVKKIDIAGGVAVPLSDFPPGSWRGGAWNRDGVIVFGSANRLFRVAASGGVAVPLTLLDDKRQELDQGAPSFLPDGRHFLYTRRFRNPASTGIFIGSLDARPETQGSKRVLAAQFDAVYAPSPRPDAGFLLFAQNGVLMGQPFDNRRLELTGAPQPVAEGVGSSFANFGSAWFSASASGVLAFRQPVAIQDSDLTWFDRRGRVLGSAAAPGIYNTVALSPDGTRVASDPQPGPHRTRDVWVYDLPRGTATRLAPDPGMHWLPVWSPDGRQIVFFSGLNADFGDLRRKASSGAGPDDVLLESNDAKYPQSWSPDGRFLLYSAVHSATVGSLDLWLLPLAGPGGAPGKPLAFLQTGFNESQGRFSPDGRFIAYSSDESGKTEIYVVPFLGSLDGNLATDKWTVSKGGGTQPVWRRDGKEIFYISPDSNMMAVEVSTAPNFKAGVPKVLFAAPILGGGGVNNVHRYDVAADGQRFLINSVIKTAAPPAPPPITVVLNWQEGLKK